MQNNQNLSFKEKVKMEKERIRNEVKKILNSYEIPYVEDEEHIRIEGKIIGAELNPYSSITIETKRHEIITIEDREGKYVIYYYKWENGHIFRDFEIQKPDLPFTHPLIYFHDKELVFLL